MIMMRGGPMMIMMGGPGGAACGDGTALCRGAAA